MPRLWSQPNSCSKRLQVITSSCCITDNKGLPLGTVLDPGLFKPLGPVAVIGMVSRQVRITGNKLRFLVRTFVSEQGEAES